MILKKGSTLQSTDGLPRVVFEFGEYRVVESFDDEDLSRVWFLEKQKISDRMGVKGWVDFNLKDEYATRKLLERLIFQLMESRK